jgi:hypothetical protein
MRLVKSMLACKRTGVGTNGILECKWLPKTANRTFSTANTGVTPHGSRARGIGLLVRVAGAGVGAELAASASRLSLAKCVLPTAAVGTSADVRAAVAVAATSPATRRGPSVFAQILRW